MGDLRSIGPNAQTHRRPSALNDKTVSAGIHRMRLTTGTPPMRAEDDSAAFITAAKLRGIVREQTQALVNIGDARSMLTVAEDSLETIMDVLTEMKELTIEAANLQENVADERQQGGGGQGQGNGNGNGGTSETEATLRDLYKSRLDALSSEIDDVTDATRFNGNQLLSGNGSSYAFLVNVTPFDVFAVSIASASAAGLDVGADDVDVSTNEAANETLGRIDAAISLVGERLAGVGEVQNRLSYKYETLSLVKRNFVAARSRIADADFAREQTDVAKLRIVEDAGRAMLSQANVSARNVLRLVRPPASGPSARIYSLDSARNEDDPSARTPLMHRMRRIGGTSQAFETFSPREAG